MIPMSKAEKEEKEKVEKKQVQVTISKSPFGYAHDWPDLYSGRVPPEVFKLIDDVAQYGIEKWKVVSYLLSQYVGMDPLEIAKSIAGWEFELIAKWKALMKSEGVR